MGDNIIILLADVFPVMFIDHRRVSGSRSEESDFKPKSPTQAKSGLEWATLFPQSSQKRA